MASKVSVNTANAHVLGGLPGIGPGLADRIVQYRERVGAFRTVDELAAVAGISERMVERLRTRVSMASGDAPATSAPAATQRVQVVLRNAAQRPYPGHTISASFTRRERSALAGADAAPVWVPASMTRAVDPAGESIFDLPEREDLRGDLTWRVHAPDGERLHEASVPGEKLPTRLEFNVAPREYAQTSPNTDPAAGKPTRLKGRVIDEAGRAQVARKQVVIWGADVREPASGDFRALIVVQTDANGYFSGPYPTGFFSSAFGAVALGEDEPVNVVIHLADDGTFPESLILVVDLDEVAPPGKEEDDCGCHAATEVPRDPDVADLGRADGTYSSDPGAGRCVDFTKPDRTLEEFGYSYVVRTTEPTIKGLTLREPAKIDISQLVGLLPTKATTSLRALAGSDDTDDAKAAIESAAVRTTSLATERLDAGILQSLARDPDGFSLTQVAAAAELTVHGDLLRVIGQHLGKLPGRQPLTCGNPVDWDHEPTIYQACSIAHGHVLRFKQEWVADGYSMGNLLYSLPLAPGQKKQIAVVDWERRESAARSESIETREDLDASISRDRDINEIVNATVNESMRGGSKSSSGSIAGGIGVGAILGPVGGLIGVGGGTSSASSSSWQNSSRSTAASALNQLRDRTIQSASSLRSQRSTVVQTTRQGERIVATTETVANYNHCHAITIQYFEVLRHLLVRQRLADVQECLFIPLLMSRFDSGKAMRWRNTLRGAVINRRLRAGFDALERIKANYVGSDFPDGSYADQLVEHVDGDLQLRFEIARPRDDNDDFDANAWLFLAKLFPSLSAADFHRQFLKGQALKDRIFQQQLAPKIAERFVQHLQFFAIDQANVRTRIPIDTTLVSDYADDRPLYVSLRLAGALPPLRRKDIRTIEISDISGMLNLPFLQILPSGSKVLVQSGNLQYRTKHSSGWLFRDARILNDVVGGDSARVPTPLSREELRNPKEEDKELVRNLLDHLNEHIEHFHHCLWRSMNDSKRYMLLDGFEAPNAGGRSVASVVENELIGIVGNSLIMPVARGFHLDPTFRQDIEEPIDLLEHYQPNTPIEPSRVAVPTRGVYAEAVMGACNSCERKEEERFWRWEESPLPDQPPPILPVSTDSRRSDAPDLTPKDYPAPIIAMQNAPAAPDPTGLGAAMQLLGTPNLFRDAAGLEGTQKNAAAALQSAFDTAQFFGGKAADLALQGKMARDIDKAVKTIASAKQGGLITEAQAQELTKSAISGMIGGGARPGDDDKLTSVPEVKEAIQRASDSAGGEISLSRSNGNGRENLDVKIPGDDSGRSWIIEPADRNAWARARAFSPSANGGDKTGTTRLTVRTRPVPEGGSVRWSVPPDQIGRYTLKGGARTQTGLTADVTAIQPGLSAIDFDVLDAGGTSVESQKYPLSIPQFVSVEVDAATFTPLLRGYNLIDFEIDQVLGVAREVCNTVLQRANVRTVWLALGESLPAQYGTGQPGAAMVTRATFRDSAGAALYGQCHAPFGPRVFNEAIDVFAGAFDDAVAGNANQNLDEVTNQVIATVVGSGLTSSAEKDLALNVLGRVYGETLAHEIGHSLIGVTLDSVPHRDHNAHPGVTGDLMNLGIDRSFENRTGCSLNGGVVRTPIIDNLSLLPGIGLINVPTGTALAQIEAFVPVPPTFR